MCYIFNKRILIRVVTSHSLRNTGIYVISNYKVGNGAGVGGGGGSIWRLVGVEQEWWWWWEALGLWFSNPAVHHSHPYCLSQNSLEMGMGIKIKQTAHYLEYEYR